MKTTLVINGLPVDAEFADSDIRNIYLPLMDRLAELKKTLGRRIVCFVAGPPASGKSTLCAFLAALAPNVQTVGIDGFHYPNRYLESHTTVRDGRTVPLMAVKGAPESYDAAALKALLDHIGGDVRFPTYDRRIHEPVPDAVRVTGDILLVEGNWLLLREAPWNEMRCDFSVFLGFHDPAQLERIVCRKMAGGYTEAEARHMVRTNDCANIEYCMRNSRPADLNLRRGADGALEIGRDIL